MPIVRVWTTSDSYIEYLTDDDGTIVGIIHGGNIGGPYDATAEPTRRVLVEPDSVLADLTNAITREVKRLSTTLAV
jgi:hypothetical protein